MRMVERIPWWIPVVNPRWSCEGIQELTVDSLGAPLGVDKNDQGLSGDFVGESRLGSSCPLVYKRFSKVPSEPFEVGFL